MNWFWRATIAFLVGWVLRFVLESFVGLAYRPPMGNVAIVWLLLFHALTYSLDLAAVIAVYALLTRRYYQRGLFDRETRCRQCRYILRGITEPRCPECGERI